MRLTRLELKGFKSFRDKTVLDFPDKFTGVVGPNGSGKSNITEAICFVLGKSRGLRAANLQELIFNGGIGGEPAQKTVVAITLKDDSGVRHKATRIVDREGNSTYKLDDKKSTRQQILDIVGDSEYNIILQDDITKVVEMRPKDRRRIIDDLCGIGVYDEKRDKALRELEKVEERISQTHIILGEKQAFMQSLRKERDEALKYTEVRDELRSTKASLLAKEVSSLERRDEKIEELVALVKQARGEALREVADLKGEIQSKNGRLRVISLELLRLEEEKKGARITELRGEVLRHEDRIGLLLGQDEALSIEENDKKGALSNSSALQRGTESRLNECEVLYESKGHEVESESKKAVDVALETELDLVKSRIYEARSRMKALDELGGRKNAELAGLRAERDGLEAKLKVGVTEEQGKLKDVERSHLEHEQYSGDFKKFEAEYTQLNEEVNAARQRLEEERIRLTRLESELSTIMRTSGGMHQAVRAVLTLKKVLPGIHGAVSQLGEVKDDIYSTALQVAAGGRMQFVVVSTVSDAAKCIDYLKQKKIGRCTLLPLDKLSAKTQDKAPKEAIGFARDHIKYSSKFAKVFEYVFGDTLIVKDIEAAKRIGIGSWRMVTLDGDLMELSGAMTGGHIGERAEITFSNIDDLEREVAVLASAVSGSQAAYEEKVAARKRLDNTLMLLRERLRQSKEALDKAVLDGNIISERRGAIRDRLNKVVESIAAMEKDMAESGLEATKLDKSAGADEKRLKEMASGRERGQATKLDGLKDALRVFEVEKTQLTERLTHVKQQAEALRARLAEIGRSRESIGSEVKVLREKIRSFQSGLAELERAHQSVGGEMQKLIGERGSLEVELTDLSSKITETENGMAGASQELNDYAVEKAKISTRLEDLRREYSKYEGVALIEKSVKDMEDAVVKLEGELTSFGSVNMRSIETFDVIRAEFDDITSKLETLKKERQSIFDFMDKIESKKRDTFMEAFEKVKANFERIYVQLADGKGTLTLDNPMNISESGLIITASPGGKRLMSLDAMSGGEKVLTSSAFLLGLQQYKPAYFYVVDELDAALDKRNSVRLAELLAASSSQFLMVTHNMNMLKYMDSAIGVSMVQGASQIVGVRFSDEKVTEFQLKQEPSTDLDAEEAEPAGPPKPEEPKAT